MKLQSLNRPILLILRLLILTVVLSVSWGAPMLPARAAQPTQAEDDIYMPLITKDKCYGLREQTIFGVQVYGGSGVDSPYHDYFFDLGATWIRNQLEWGAVEPADVAPAQYNWAVADATVAAAVDSCMNVVLTHLSSPAWAASKPEGPINQAALPDFAEYMGALAERYDGDGVDDAPSGAVVNYFEIYNEPDAKSLPNGGRWGDDGAAYGAMLKAIYPAIKAANPNAQVVFGGLAYDGFTDAPGGSFVRKFLDDVLAVSGVGNAFDYMNFHVYPAFSKDWTGSGNGPGLIEKTNAIRKKLTDKGINKPFLITEVGWHNNSPPDFPSNDEVQGRFVVKFYAETLAADVEMSIWWPLIDLDGYPYDTGLVTALPPRQKKAAFAVYEVAISELADVEFVETLPQSQTGNANLSVHKFLDNGQTLYVAWYNPATRNDTTSSAPLSLPANGVSVRTMNGSTSNVLDQADGRRDGRVTLPISGPVYIRVTQ